jgi:hypothetical protein
MVFNACVATPTTIPETTPWCGRPAAAARSSLRSCAATRGGARRRDLALIVRAHGRAASLHNLLSACGRFGLSEEARAEFNSVVAVVRTWREVFRELGVVERDIEVIAPAFLYNGSLRGLK